jgi:hypothetical protein
MMTAPGAWRLIGFVLLFLLVIGAQFRMVIIISNNNNWNYSYRGSLSLFLLVPSRSRINPNHAHRYAQSINKS